MARPPPPAHLVHIDRLQRLATREDDRVVLVVGLGLTDLELARQPHAVHLDRLGAAVGERPRLDQHRVVLLERRRVDVPARDARPATRAPCHACDARDAREDEDEDEDERTTATTATTTAATTTAATTTARTAAATAAAAAAAAAATTRVVTPRGSARERRGGADTAARGERARADARDAQVRVVAKQPRDVVRLRIALASLRAEDLARDLRGRREHDIIIVS